MTPIQTPMIGNWTVRVVGVRSYTIHGDLYYELHVVRTDTASAGGASAGGALVIKVPQHAVVGEPQVGQVLAITFLMGQVTGAHPVAAEST
jgi:hypothetical protein